MLHQLPLSLRQPHSGRLVPVPTFPTHLGPINTPVTSSSFDSPICSSITPSLSLRLKT